MLLKVVRGRGRKPSVVGVGVGGSFFTIDYQIINEKKFGKSTYCEGLSIVAFGNLVTEISSFQSIDRCLKFVVSRLKCKASIYLWIISLR